STLLASLDVDVGDGCRHVYAVLRELSVEEVDTGLIRPFVVVEPDERERSLLAFQDWSGPDRVAACKAPSDVRRAVDVRLSRRHPPAPNVGSILLVEVLGRRVRAKAHDSFRGELARVRGPRFSGAVERSEHTR